MKVKILTVVILTLVGTLEVNAKDKISASLRPLYAKFGENSTTKIEIVSGPTDVKMRNGRVPGKQWFATSGKYRFKLTIQDGTGVTVGELVKRLEKLPASYMKACKEVSDKGEDGIAVYASLGGARAHGGKGYINIVPHADALVIAHEAGHTLEQVARQYDPEILEMWKDVIKADKISISDYGDHVHSEDLAEFAQVYAVCLGAGPEHLTNLKKISPMRYALWETIMEADKWKEITIDLGAGVKMDFILIRAGEFMMGSGESTEAVVKAFDLPEIFVHYLKNEHPRHRVRITKPFYMGKYEATQEQWMAIMGSNPSFRKGAKNPVETVSWDDCQAFIKKLNDKLGKPGVKFSLPTEAQWEYACRAGTTTLFSFGDDKSSLEEYVWYGRSSVKKLQPVGQKKPNPWGLYDIHGNIGEWCADRYDEDGYKQSPENDPTGPSKGISRVVRGGSFYEDTPDFFRCADRYHDHPDYRYYRYGLRVVRTFTH